MHAKQLYSVDCPVAWTESVSIRVSNCSNPSSREIQSDCSLKRENLFALCALKARSVARIFHICCLYHWNRDFSV